MRIKYLAATALLLLAFYPQAAAKTSVKNTVQPFLIVKKQQSFPDYTDNYQKTVVEPAQRAQEAAQQALEAQVVTYTPPVIQYPSLAPNAAKLFIYNMESGNNPGAINPSSGACGLGQAWPCSKMPCSLSNYNCQDNFFTDYANQRYGGWQAAYNYWLSHHNW